MCVETVNKYSKKAAIVQTGWRTQLVSAHKPFLHSHPPPHLLPSDTCRERAKRNVRVLIA